VRRDAARLADIVDALHAIHSHIARGSMDDGLIYDAVRVRLIEIGEAVKDIDPLLLAHEPTIPWSDIAGMRDFLTHRYFDTEHGYVVSTVQLDLPPLAAAVGRLQLLPRD
jgi:uncharacterized protein with HEPN domain